MEIIKKHKKRKGCVTGMYFIQCDKCGKKINVNNYDAFECGFIRKTGSNYPEGGRGFQETLDICLDCSVKLTELLKENGYNIQCKEWGW